MSYEHPSVYIATYSNTDVYECTVGEAPIMRRCKDDWVNATQILKLCDFPKAKRTKILEKGVQQGLHEKVQGGYGRFQGTWIPLEDARRLAKEYNISPELVPVLYVDLDDPAVVIRRKSKGSGAKENTPVKRKYVRKTPGKDAVTPKKTKYDDRLPPQAVFTQDYPHALSRGGSNVPQMSNMSQMGMPVNMGHMEAQEYVPDNMGQMTYQRTANYPKYSIPETGYPAMYGKTNFRPEVMMYQRQKASSHSTNETNWSQEEHTRDSDTSVSSDPKLALLEEDSSHVAQLLRFFAEDGAQIPYFLYNPPPEFNVNEAIDDEGHSTLHWAASVGNMELVHLLLSKGASPLVVSNFGLNPLSKCIAFNNCYDLKNFPLVVDALEMCLINTDINGRTPLHYLCQFSKVPSKLPALAYYLDVVFKKLRAMARHSGAGVDLIKNVIDHQDVNGDTCLHLAARAGCSQFVKFFLSSGARDDLMDLTSQTAKTLIMQLDSVVYNFEPMGPGSMLDKRPYHSAGMQKEQVPTFQVSRPEPKTVSGLGTPIRTYSRLAETPDTQRTTIQDEDVDELHDRVSKEHLQMLSQAGTVDDNKENIFVDEHSKTPCGSSSTPKQSHVQAPKHVLGVISERVSENSSEPNENAAESSPLRSYSPHPPQLDRSGRVVETHEDAGKNDVEVKLPMKDVSSMVNGMMHSLSTSYEEQLSGLKGEHERVKTELDEKKAQDKNCARQVKTLLDKYGFEGVNTLEDADSEVVSVAQKYSQDLRLKEAQLQCSLGKWHAYELAGLVEEQESRISEIDESPHAEEKWDLGVQLSQVQLRRVKLARMLAVRIRDYAITTKMNKYRKLLSLSCGLKVEDIDGLIQGIEDSLNKTTTEV